MNAAANDGVAARAVTEALAWVGTPYRHQGSRRGVGCDCLGLVLGVWRALHGEEPERPGAYAMDWNETRAGDPLIDAARRHCIEKPPGTALPGDLLAFRWRPEASARHLGILVSPGRFVHAYERHGVVTSPLGGHWRRRIAGVFAFPGPKEG